MHLRSLKTSRLTILARVQTVGVSPKIGAVFFFLIFEVKKERRSVLILRKRVSVT
jgi:hypothetical protein